MKLIKTYPNFVKVNNRKFRFVEIRKEVIRQNQIVIL